MPARIDELNSTNCKTYLIASGTEAALVDPVRERYETYRKDLAERGLTLRMILETHTHADHLMLNRELKEGLGAPIFMHRESPSPLVDHHLVDGDTVTLGDTPIRVMHTPGHTPDSITFYIADTVDGAGAVLTGDTLLIGGSGRTDFPGGDAGKQYDAVVHRLFTLPPETRVLPAHDYKGRTSSTIREEREANPRFVGKSRDEYVALMGSLGLPFPDKIQQALQVNQSGFEAEEVAFPKVTDVAVMGEISAGDLSARLGGPSAPLVLDVREPEEFTGELGHIRGALLVPMDALARRLPKLAGYVDRDVVVVCRAGARSASAAVILKQAGFGRVKNLAGGMLAWVGAGLAVEH
jgi:glyoxylase-like metal-dependent hydrolase (beta-lactamase superfamily II)/rhodanese-related sulfurtransferase